MICKRVAFSADDETEIKNEIKQYCVHNQVDNFSIVIAYAHVL